MAYTPTQDDLDLIAIIDEIEEEDGEFDDILAIFPFIIYDEEDDESLYKDLQAREQ
jgi:hypothetical protein